MLLEDAASALLPAARQHASVLLLAASALLHAARQHVMLLDSPPPSCCSTARLSTPSCCSPPQETRRQHYFMLLDAGPSPGEEEEPPPLASENYYFMLLDAGPSPGERASAGCPPIPGNEEMPYTPTTTTRIIKSGMPISRSSFFQHGMPRWSVPQSGGLVVVPVLAVGSRGVLAEAPLPTVAQGSALSLGGGVELLEDALGAPLGVDDGAGVGAVLSAGVEAVPVGVELPVWLVAASLWPGLVPDDGRLVLPAGMVCVEGCSCAGEEGVAEGVDAGGEPFPDPLLFEGEAEPFPEPLFCTWIAGLDNVPNAGTTLPAGEVLPGTLAAPGCSGPLNPPGAFPPSPSPDASGPGTV